MLYFAKLMNRLTDSMRSTRTTGRRDINVGNGERNTIPYDPDSDYYYYYYY